MSKYLTVVFLIAFTFAATGFCDDDISYKFLNISPSAAGRGMADAASAGVADISALYYNPAGLASVSRGGIAINEMEWIAGLRLLQVSYAAPVLKGSAGIGITYFGMKSFDQFDALENITGDPISKADYSIDAGYGYSFFKNRLLAGIGFRFIKSILMNEDTTAFAFNAGLEWNMIKKNGENILSAAAIVKNIGQPVSSYGNQDSLPAVAIFGMNYVPLDNKDHLIRVSAEGAQYIESVFEPRFGIEYGFHHSVFARMGYRFNNNMESLSLGLGGVYNIKSLGLKADAAWSPAKYGENPLSFSIGLEYLPQTSSEKKEEILKDFSQGEKQ